MAASFPRILGVYIFEAAQFYLGSKTPSEHRPWNTCLQCSWRIACRKGTRTRESKLSTGFCRPQQMGMTWLPCQRSLRMHQRVKWRAVRGSTLSSDFAGDRHSEGNVSLFRRFIPSVASGYCGPRFPSRMLVPWTADHA